MAHNNPVVSVILPTYNRANILAKAIESVLSQTYKNFELIIIDDASTDDTGAVIKNFDDDRIKYIEHTQNEGAPAARNTGIGHARGEYVAFQDSDDEWLPSKLEQQLRAFQNASDSVGVVYTGMVRAEAGDMRYLPYPGVEQTTGDIRRSLARQNFISTPVALVKRACFDEVGTFDEKAWPLSDWELWIRISQHFSFELVDEPLVTGEVRADSISTNQRALVESRRKIVDKHTEFFDNDSLSNHLFYIGHGLAKVGDVQQARSYLIRSFKINPTPVRAGSLILSLLGPTMYKKVYVHYKNIANKPVL